MVGEGRCVGSQRRCGGEKVPLRPTPFPCRHRACNMFLESYKAAWILTEDHSFEDRMIDDLSVSWGLPGNVGAERARAPGEAAHCTPTEVVLHIEGYGKGVPWLGQKQGRVEDVREEKNIQPRRALGETGGDSRSPSPKSHPSPQSVMSRKQGSRRRKRRRWRRRSQTPCTSSSCTSAAQP